MRRLTGGADPLFQTANLLHMSTDGTRLGGIGFIHVHHAALIYLRQGFQRRLEPIMRPRQHRPRRFAP